MKAQADARKIAQENERQIAATDAEIAKILLDGGAKAAKRSAALRTPSASQSAASAADPSALRSGGDGVEVKPPSEPPASCSIRRTSPVDALSEPDGIYVFYPRNIVKHAPRAPRAPGRLSVL